MKHLTGLLLIGVIILYTGCTHTQLKEISGDKIIGIFVTENEESAIKEINFNEKLINFRYIDSLNPEIGCSNDCLNCTVCDNCRCRNKCLIYMPAITYVYTDYKINRNVISINYREISLEVMKNGSLIGRGEGINNVVFTKPKYTERETDYEYIVDTDQNGIVITGYITSDTNRENHFIQIPQKINNIPVVAIGKEAFTRAQTFRSSNLYNLKEVIIPVGVTRIDDYAFRYSGLINVLIPDTVISVGQGAFQSTLGRLSSVIIGKNVTTIGREAFSNNDLLSIIIPEKVIFIGAMAFFDNQIYNITIPANVELEEYSSAEMDKLMNVNTVFPFNFDSYYITNGRKAGTYVFDGTVWRRQ